MIFPKVLNHLTNGNDLDEATTTQVMEEMMSGQLEAVEIAAFLVALKAKGESEAEIAGMAKVMRKFATPVAVDFPVFDTCGTGGDNSNTFNISTAAAFVLAAAGVKVAKHGNRSVSSQSGSADVLEALGVKVQLSPESVAKCVKETRLGFMFAPAFHPAMKHVMPARKALKIRTVFNILGPLTNPANATRQVLGVYAEDLLPTMAATLKTLGAEHAFVVYGSGLDEVALHGPTMVYEVTQNEIKHYSISPEDFGLAPKPLSDLAGGDAEENAKIIRKILSGQLRGAKSEALALNVAAGLVAADKAEDWVAAFSDANALIQSGKAVEKIDELAQLSQTLN